MVRENPSGTYNTSESLKLPDVLYVKEPFLGKRQRLILCFLKAEMFAQMCPQIDTRF